MKLLVVFMVIHFLIFTCNVVDAQVNHVVTRDFNAVTFSHFVEEIEKETGLHFFYDRIELDSIVVNIETSGRYIGDILKSLFESKNIHFAMDNQKNVFIVKGKYIQANLPANFFDGSDSINSKFASLMVLSTTQRSNQIRTIGKLSGRVSSLAVISGRIIDEKGFPVIGASIHSTLSGNKAISNDTGEFILTVKLGEQELVIKALGMKELHEPIIVYDDGSLDVTMTEEVKILQEVVVQSERDINLRGVQMGRQKLDMKSMKKMPSLMGEVDVLRVMLALPGVQSVGEASTGLNIRGGSASQNLILYDDAVVFNPTHLFGFFTAFNPDAIGETEIMKSSIPAELGGRLSSVIDIESRNGNLNKFAGSGGVGPLTGKLTIETPVIKDRASILLGGRASYSDWLLKRIPDQSISNSSASFRDFNFIFYSKLNESNSFKLSTYLSQDRFQLNNDSIYDYQNRVISIKWRHSFSDYLNSSISISKSNYGYQVSSSAYPSHAFDMEYRITQTDLKADFSYSKLKKHSMNFGSDFTFYMVKPGRIEPLGDSSLIKRDKLQNESAFELCLFVADNYDISDRLSLYGGIRYSFFSALGPRSVYRYIPGVPKNENTIIDTTSVSQFKSAAIYHGPEFRISVRYNLGTGTAFKASYNVLRQYIQMLSNTTSISPTDVWKLSDTHIKPQVGSQISIGLYKNLSGNLYEVSLEGYYKTTKNILDYKDGANLILNHAIESDVLNANGLAYGIEFMIKKNLGKLSGWLSYAYSRSLLSTKSSFASETVNNGKYYPSNYDKPHAVNIIGNYKFSHRFGISLNSTYSTGRPITLPLAKYDLNEAYRLLYSERNQYRVDDYYRFDLSINVEGNHKIKKLAHSSWTFGVYNITGRKNIYSVYFQQEGQSIVGYKLSIFGTAIPSITYNFKF